MHLLLCLLVSGLWLLFLSAHHLLFEKFFFPSQLLLPLLLLELGLGVIFLHTVTIVIILLVIVILVLPVFVLQVLHQLLQDFLLDSWHD
jgi:hypothetical protein